MTYGIASFFTELPRDAGNAFNSITRPVLSLKCKNLMELLHPCPLAKKKKKLKVRQNGCKAGMPMIAAVLGISKIWS